MPSFMQLLRYATGLLGALDWSLISVVVAFGVAEHVAFEEPRPVANTRDPAHLAYAAAIADAAVKQPSFRVELETIPATTTTVTVVSFGPSKELPPEPRRFEIWAALPEQLRAACKGAPDSTRRLQEILGMPPVAASDYVVRQLQVSRDALMRPCLAGGDLANPYCEFLVASASSSSVAPAASSAPVASSSAAPASSSAPRAPAPSPSAHPHPAASAPAPSAVASAAPAPSANAAVSGNANRAYDELSLLTAQLWNSYRGGFPADGRATGDYPYTGFPFTGMGWSYDWSDVPNHIGVTEFIVRRDAKVTVVTTQKPSEFCAK